jgi:hypothetical protein
LPKTIATHRKIYCRYCPFAVDTDEPRRVKNLLAVIKSRYPPQRDLPISCNIAPTQDVLSTRLNLDKSFGPSGIIKLLKAALEGTLQPKVAVTEG